MVVLASSSSLDACMSQQLLMLWGADPRNVVMLVQTPPVASLAHKLCAHAQTHHPGTPYRFEMMRGRRVPLNAEELAAKEAAEAEIAAKAAAVAAALVRPLLSQLCKNTTLGDTQSPWKLA